MSGAVLGAIEVQMLMDLARWQQDIANSGRMLDAGLGKMKSAISGVMGGLMAGLSVAAFTSWIKGAIDAGDEAYNLGQKIGVATKDLAGIQLAFKQVGVDGGAMQTAMVKLAKNVADGDDAFKRMGVAVRNADGSLKSSKQVLYDVADVFQDMPDGINKTALATEVFGKAGADLLPMLSQGSEGLQEMADMAEKLGLVISDETAKSADDFNDTLELVGMAGQGVARQVAAELLPTLKSLAGTFLQNVTSGDAVAKAAEFLAIGLKVLFSTALWGAEVFNSLGKTAAAVAGVVVSVAQGEFAQAREIWRAADADIQASNKQTEKTVSDLWSGAAVQAADKALALTKAVGGTNVVTKEQADAAKKAAEEQAKLTKAGQDYLTQLNAEYGALMQSISLGRELTEGEKALLKLEEQLAAGKIKLTDAERLSAEAKLREIDAVKEQRKQQDEYLKLIAAVAQHASKWNDEQAKTTETLRAGNVQLIEQNEKLRIGDAAWAARERAVLLNQAADLEWQAANQGGNFQLEEQARLLRDRATLLADGTVLQEAKAAADEWKKTTESIQNGLTDALMRGFESGKGFAENFADVLKNAFKTLVLKPMVDEMVKSVSGGMQSGMAALSSWYNGTSGGGAGKGGAGTAAGSGGAGAAAGLGWYAWILAGIMQSKSDYDKGWNRQGLDQGWNRNINYAINPIYSSVIKPLEKLGLLNSKWADILGGDTAMARMFGRKPAEVTAQGVSGNFGGGTFAGQQFADWKAQGGWFRSDKTGTNFAAVDAQLGATLSGSAQAILAKTKDYASALALPIAALNSVTTTARIELGEDAEKNAAAIAKALGDYSEALVKDYEAQLAAASDVGETAVDTLARLGTAITSVNTVFEALGLHLVQTSVAGGQAASELVNLTGGLDAFMAKTQAYLANYFTRSEQLGLGAKGVLETLQQAGIDFGGASSRGDLRSLMEQLDPNTANGRGQMAALLNVSADFARLTDYLQESGLTLGALAALAPKSGALLGAADPSRTTSDDATRSTALLATANDSLSNIASSSAGAVTELQALVATTVAANKTLIDRIAELSARLEEMQRPAYLADLNQA